MSTSPGDPPLRVMIVDDHPISRCAVGALLRSEGAEVIAELASDEAPVDAVRTLGPDLVIVDVRPGHRDAFEVARGMASVCAAVVLTSSARPESFGSALDGFAFIAKADICRSQLGGLITAERDY